MTESKYSVLLERPTVVIGVSNSVYRRISRYFTI